MLGTHAFEMFALVVSASYDKLAERFLGQMPPEATSAALGPNDPALRVTREKAMSDLAARGIGCKMPQAHEPAAPLSALTLTPSHTAPETSRLPQTPPAATLHALLTASGGSGGASSVKVAGLLVGAARRCRQEGKLSAS